MIDKHCEFVSGGGKRCRAYKITNSKHCFTHSDDPKVIIKRKEALKKAADSHRVHLYIAPVENGKVDMNLPQVIDLNNSKAIKKAYITIFKAAAMGVISEKRAGTLIFILNGFVNALDKMDILGRIENLERLLEEKEDVLRWI